MLVVLNAMFISYHWYIQATWKDIESATKNLETSDTPTQVSKFELALIIITILEPNYWIVDDIQFSAALGCPQDKPNLV